MAPPQLVNTPALIWHGIVAIIACFPQVSIKGLKSYLHSVSFDKQLIYFCKRKCEFFH
jgi:hypothetical protein